MCYSPSFSIGREICNALVFSLSLCFPPTAHSIFVIAYWKFGQYITRMETVQNVCANVWRNPDDVRSKTCSVGAVVLGEKLVGLSKGQSQRERGSVALCDTRGKLAYSRRHGVYNWRFQFDFSIVSFFKVYEETGYDIGSLAKPDQFIEGVLNYQYTRLYLIRDVPIETVFVPRTRKEIKCCEWFSIEHLPKHKMDPVSRNHLGINPNSFFMIMPFVKRLKKWIYEQETGGNHAHHQLGKKANACDSRHMMAAGVINSNAKPIQFNNSGGGGGGGDRNDVKSPSVTLKNNGAGNRRQRHKSMGDFDSTNVVAHDSTGDTRIGSKQQQQPSGNRLNGCTDLNGVAKSIGGKRKLFTNDQTSAMRSSSPYASNFQLQPVLAVHSNGNSKQLVLNSLAAAEAAAAAAEATESSTSRKKKSAKSQRHQNGDDGAMHVEYQSENEHHGSGQQKRWLFNPPKLSQLLCKEPNIAKWSNIRLNKDSIVHESLKSSGRKQWQRKCKQ